MRVASSCKYSHSRLDPVLQNDTFSEKNCPNNGIAPHCCNENDSTDDYATQAQQRLANVNKVVDVLTTDAHLAGGSLNGNLGGLLYCPAKPNLPVVDTTGPIKGPAGEGCEEARSEHLSTDGDASQNGNATETACASSLQMHNRPEECTSYYYTRTERRNGKHGAPDCEGTVRRDESADAVSSEAYKRVSVAALVSFF